MEDIRFISQWFEREEGAGLVLPDGWYGRPFDNLLNLISIERDAIVLVIELDSGLVLHFTGLRNIQSHGHDLVFSDFDSLQFKENGPGISGGTKVYSDGEVRLVSQSFPR